MTNRHGDLDVNERRAAERRAMGIPERSGYAWSDASAMWQATHGEPGTERTQSAFTHLEVSLNGGDAETCRALALSLLGTVEALRGQS